MCFVSPSVSRLVICFYKHHVLIIKLAHLSINLLVEDNIAIIKKKV